MDTAATALVKSPTSWLEMLNSKRQRDFNFARTQVQLGKTLDIVYLYFLFLIYILAQRPKRRSKRNFFASTSKSYVFCLNLGRLMTWIVKSPTSWLEMLNSKRQTDFNFARAQVQLGKTFDIVYLEFLFLIYILAKRPKRRNKRNFFASTSKSYVYCLNLGRLMIWIQLQQLL